MALQKPLFLNSNGFHEQMADADSIKLGGLTMSGNIAMGSNKITGLADPVDSGDAVSKSYFEQKLVQGGHFRELLLDARQCSDIEGILPATLLIIDSDKGGLPGDAIVITDGTTTETYTYNEMGWRESLYGINSGALCYLYSTGSEPNIGTGTRRFAVIGRSASAVLRIYGTATGVTYVNSFVGAVEYTVSSSTALPSNDPTTSNFGFAEAKANLSAGELHYCEVDDSVRAWDSDTDTWWTVSTQGTVYTAEEKAKLGRLGEYRGEILFPTQWTDGLQYAGLMTYAQNAETTQIFHITDAYDDKTFDVADYATIEALALAINTDAFFTAEVSTAFPEIAAKVLLITRTGGVGYGAQRIWGEATCACQIVDFTNTADWSKSTLSALPSTDPVTSNCGLGYYYGQDLGTGIWYCRSNQCFYSVQTGAANTSVVTASIVDATSASGGGTKGKITVDSDKGLSVASGVLGIDLKDTDPGLELTSGLAVKLNATTPGLSLTDGLAVKVDGTTITVDGSGNLTATSNASQADAIQNVFTAGASIAKADPVYMTSTANTVDKADADTDALSYVLGVAIEAKSSGDIQIVSHGPATLWESGGVAGSRYWLQANGGIGTSMPAAGNRLIQVGYGMNATDLFVDIKDYGKLAA